MSKVLAILAMCVVLAGCGETGSHKVLHDADTSYFTRDGRLCATVMDQGVSGFRTKDELGIGFKRFQTRSQAETYVEENWCRP